MGKVRLDPMFMDLNKRVGNYVHCKWKGQHVIKTYNPDRAASTAAQVEVQNAFKVTAELWRKLPEVIKQSWKPYTTGKPVTELNLFIKENSARQRLGNPYLLTKGNGIPKLNGLTADSAEPGVITIDFEMPGDVVNLHIILQPIIEGLGTSEAIIKTDVYTGTKPVTITGLAGGSAMFLYCFVTDSVYNDAALVSESAGIKVTVA